MAIAATGIEMEAQEMREPGAPVVPTPPARPGGQPQPRPAGTVRPALIAVTDLAGFATLPAGRRKLIEAALAVAKNSPWLPYLPGGADPAGGGFDCSGAMYYVMRQCGLAPPRTSSGQYHWVRDHHLLHRVADGASAADDPSLAGLRPGDLLFWGSGGMADDDAGNTITHVAMYLGREAKDGRQVMINATDGRSYRGTKANGYGVYDFRLPGPEAKARLVGYGPPPGLSEVDPPTGPMP